MIRSGYNPPGHTLLALPTPGEPKIICCLLRPSGYINHIRLHPNVLLQVNWSASHDEMVTHHKEWILCVRGAGMEDLRRKAEDRTDGDRPSEGDTVEGEEPHATSREHARVRETQLKE